MAQRPSQESRPMDAQSLSLLLDIELACAFILRYCSVPPLQGLRPGFQLHGELDEILQRIAVALAKLTRTADGEASMDLGASYWGTLLRVTLPISAPALIAAFLSCFTTSFDEFTLAFFLTSTDNTLPVYLYSQLRFVGSLPIVVALAALIMVVSILLLVISEWLRRYGQPNPLRGLFKCPNIRLNWSRSIKPSLPHTAMTRLLQLSI